MTQQLLTSPYGKEPGAEQKDAANQGLVGNFLELRFHVSPDLGGVALSDQEHL